MPSEWQSKKRYDHNVQLTVFPEKLPLSYFQSINGKLDGLLQYQRRKKEPFTIVLPDNPIGNKIEPHELLPEEQKWYQVVKEHMKQSHFKQSQVTLIINEKGQRHVAVLGTTSDCGMMAELENANTTLNVFSTRNTSQGLFLLVASNITGISSMAQTIEQMPVRFISCPGMELHEIMAKINLLKTQPKAMTPEFLESLIHGQQNATIEWMVKNKVVTLE